MNYYDEDLKFANNQENSKILDEIYLKRFFPTAKRIEFVIDKETQLKGFDKILYFQCGNTVTIEEKIRRKDYNDILLERYHIKNNGKKTGGWLYTSKCNYLSYSIFNNGVSFEKIYLIPFIQLQMTWEYNREEWEKKYTTKVAKNENHNTYNIAIPTNVLNDAMGNESGWKIYDKNVDL